MKRFLCLVSLLFLSFVLFACNASPKEFSKGGITLTLNTSFKESSADNAQVYYLSRKAMFMGNRFDPNDYPPTCRYDKESPDMLADHLRNDEYLQYDGKPAHYSVLETGNDGTKFAWLYYDNTVNNVEYSYMLVTKISDDYFYVMNFGCLKKDFEDLSSDFMDYAKTIKVE